MQIAHDEKSDRISVQNAIKGQPYYCPVCGSALVIKKGKIRKPHFAHKIGSDCDWGDMSDWHISWQERFPEEYREVIIEKDGIKHRADILVPKAKTVLEFQHSTISFDEFNARNQFYTDCGYRLVWVFDATNKIRPFFDDLSLEDLTFDYSYPTWELQWKRKQSAFKDYMTLNDNKAINIILEVETEQRQKKIYIVKSIGEKWIDAYKFCEDISDLNLLKTYGVVRDEKILTLKQIDDKTNSIIEKEKQRQKYLDNKRAEETILEMGVGRFFYSTRWQDDSYNP